MYTFVSLAEVGVDKMPVKTRSADRLRIGMYGRSKRDADGQEPVLIHAALGNEEKTDKEEPDKEAETGQTPKTGPKGEETDQNPKGEKDDQIPKEEKTDQTPEDDQQPKGEGGGQTPGITAE